MPTSYSHARKIRDKQFVFGTNARASITVWRVPKDKRFPDGYKYSFSFVLDEKSILRYDNYEGKGHHKHFEGREEPNYQLPEQITLRDLDLFAQKFLEEMNQIRKKRQENPYDV